MTVAHWIRMRKKERVARTNPEKFLVAAAEAGAKAEEGVMHLPNGASLSVADTAQAKLAGAIFPSSGAVSVKPNAS